MKKINLKFPNKTEFDRFIKYVKFVDCEQFPETLMIVCHPGVLELRIAMEIFKATIIEESNTIL